MAAKHHFKISIPAHGRMTSVEMDGQPLEGARAITVSTEVNRATVVTVEYVNVTAEIEGPDELTEFGDEYRKYRKPDAAA